MLIAAYNRNEPVTAIPLDQVMLREGEQNFRLWIPASAEHEIRVFDGRGLVQSATESDGDKLLVRIDR